MNTQLYYEITCRRVQQSETDISRVWPKMSIPNFNGFEGVPTEIRGVPKIADNGRDPSPNRRPKVQIGQY